MQFDLEKIKNVHIIGVGGIGISALTQLLLSLGKNISANDLDEFPMVTYLRAKGIDTKLGIENSYIPNNTELIVYSGAWTTLGPELLAYANTLGIPVLSYPEMLSIVSAQLTTIAVSGSHGKTTTTAMVAHILSDAGLDPTVIVGSIMTETGSNFREGKGKYLVVEADEYRRAFLNLTPTYLIIINIDLDHLDYYKNLDDIKDAYKSLVARVKEGGTIIADLENEHVRDVLKDAKTTIINYRDFFKPRALLQIGVHNELDAAAACALASELKITSDVYDASIATFKGTSRRLEVRGTLPSGALWIDDYAHHPTEILASLAALRTKYPRGEFAIHVIFHPHLYSRTRTLWDGFVHAWRDTNTVGFLPIYAARESLDPNVTSDKLAEAVQKEGITSIAFDSFENATTFVQNSHFSKNDIFVTMGAGEAYKIGEELLK